MNIKGIGTDITSKDRFDENNKTFNEKFLTEVELSLLEKLNGEDKINFLSGRWAGKESIVKASNKEIIYSSISILKEESGKPIVLIDDKVRNDIHISISHENSLTIAFCIIEGV